MSSVPFLRFPPSIQSEIVKAMNLRELVKFTSCSRKTHEIAKSVRVQIQELDAGFFKNSLDVEFGDYVVLINPMNRQRNPVEDVEEYKGFCGLQMYEFPTVHSDGSIDWNCVVLVPEGQTFFEISDTVLEYITSLFEFTGIVEWRITPNEPVYRMLRKHFPVIGSLAVCELGINEGDNRVMTKEEAKFVIEEFSTDQLWVHVGFENFETIINSQTRFIVLNDVRAVSSSNLNTLLKLWVSNEKLQGLGYLSLSMDHRECISFPEGLMELILEGIDHDEMDVERWAPRRLYPETLPFMRQICRVDGKLASVEVDDSRIKIYVQ